MGDFNIPLSSIDRSFREKNLNRERLELNNTISQMDLADIYRTKEYTFFLATHGTFSKIDHILGYKTTLNGYKKTGITPCILSD